MNKLAEQDGDGDKGKDKHKTQDGDKHKTFGVDTQALPVVDQALVITRNTIQYYETR
jgi:hypothetical protein